MNQFETFRNANEGKEIKRLDFFRDTARKILSGELTYGDTAYEDLTKSLTKAEEAGIDVSSFKKETEEIINQIPRAEINNILKKIEEFLESGDVASAKSWHAGLEESIRHWESKGVLESDEILSFQKQANDIGAKLYG